MLDGGAGCCCCCVAAGGDGIGLAAVVFISGILLPTRSTKVSIHRNTKENKQTMSLLGNVCAPDDDILVTDGGGMDRL